MEDDSYVPPELFLDYISSDILSELSTQFKNISISKYNTERQEIKEKCTNLITIQEVLKLNLSFYAVIVRNRDGVIDTCFIYKKENKIYIEGLTNKKFYYIINEDYDLNKLFEFIKFDIATVRRVLISLRKCPCKFTTKLTLDDIERN